MLHDIAIAGGFVAMLVVPCLITLRGEQTRSDAPTAPVSPSQPASRTR
jgi:hypothetical protein